MPSKNLKTQTKTDKCFGAAKIKTMSGDAVVISFRVNGKIYGFQLMEKTIGSESDIVISQINKMISKI